jgi:hypothetical protein
MTPADWQFIRSIALLTLPYGVGLLVVSILYWGELKRRRARLDDLALIRKRLISIDQRLEGKWQ